LMNQEFLNITVAVPEGSPVEMAADGTGFLKVIKGSKESSLDLVNKNEAIGYIDEQMNVTVKDSGIKQSILKEIADEFKQISELGVPVQNLDFDTKYVAAEETKTNDISISFYALIAMVSMYSMFSGIELSGNTQANQSTLGARMSVMPVKKSTFIIQGLTVGMIINLFANLLLIIFLKYVLKLGIINDIPMTLLIVLAGNLFGLTFGLFIGTSNNFKSNTKELIAIGTSLTLSFLTGMMGTSIKLAIEKSFPILKKINPISVMTDSLFRINNLPHKFDLVGTLSVLFVFTLIFFAASVFFLRRKRYDSI
ncbi:MAG: ABC transporter permease, partial [Clostridiaceae bacterium]